MRAIILIIFGLTGAMLTGCVQAPAAKPQLSALDTGLTKGGVVTPRAAGCDLRPRSELRLLLRSRVGIPEKPLVRVVGLYDAALVDCDRRFGRTVDIYQRRDAAVGGAK